MRTFVVQKSSQWNRGQIIRAASPEQAAYRYAISPVELINQHATKSAWTFQVPRWGYAIKVEEV
jgi:predicted NAD/FAD-dependent oxidoreductase